MKTSLLALAAFTTLLGGPLLAQVRPAGSPDPDTPEKVGKAEDTPPAPAPPERRERPKRPEAAPARPALREKPAPRQKHSGAPRTERRVHEGTRTWLGVASSPIAESLRHHLEIPPGFAIQVVEVMDGSPASKAGIRDRDILVRLDDQRLISPDHLAVLVREKAPGESVALTVIRKGREQVFDVVLGEAAEEIFDPFVRPSPHGARPPRYEWDGSPWQDQMRRQQDEFLRRQREGMERRNPGRPEHGDEGKTKNRPPTAKVNPGFPIRVFGKEGVLKIDNEQGELTLTRKDDDHHLIIGDRTGKVVYDGPFDPEKGVEGLPEAARKQLKAMKLDNFDIRLPEPPKVDPEETMDPLPEEDVESDAVL